MDSIDWSNLGFEYIKANYNIRCYYKDGKWGKLESNSSDELTMGIAATSLHYGQQVFEGLKAFRGKDGKIRIFRMGENAKRLARSAEGILMEPVPIDIFNNAVLKAVKMNEEFVPPHGSGASLYIRPLLIGTGRKVGVKPAEEYLFIVFVLPVGPYFKEGFKPTELVIYRDFDRAAPHGTGTYKVGGNYAGSMVAGKKANDEGYSAVLYLDAKEKQYIDECGPANFFGIKDNRYITPESTSILPSITNKSLQVLAEDMGLTVERRKIHIDELSSFDEVGACGTAAVISPVKGIFDADKDTKYNYGNGVDAGEVSTKLYKKLQAIQCGDCEDKFGWNDIVE